MSGVKLVRGYSNWGKTKDEKRPATPSTATLPKSELVDKEQKAIKRRSAPPLSRADSAASIHDEREEPTSGTERRENRLKREFSNYIGMRSPCFRFLNPTNGGRKLLCTELTIHVCRIYADLCVVRPRHFSPYV